MLHAAGVRLILGHAVDWKKLQRRLRDHKAKLQSDALLQLTSIASEIAGQEKQLLTAMVSGASTRNVWKNDSLYVGFVDGEFVLPSRAITPRKAERTIALAQLTLTDAKQFRVVLGQLRERSPAQVREAFKHLPTLDALPAGDVTELFLRVLKVWATLQKSHASQK
jgi:AbiV family abortive infection protein